MLELRSSMGQDGVPRDPVLLLRLLRRLEVRDSWDAVSRDVTCDKSRDTLREASRGDTAAATRSK